MISFIVPTVGRPSLAATLASIQTRPGDEILLVGDAVLGEAIYGLAKSRPEIKFVHCPRGNDWGHTERNVATPLARGQYIAHIDDDDVYVPEARELMEQAIWFAQGRPVLFRMRFPNGVTLWMDEHIRCGNIGTPCFLMPNRPTMLGKWASYVGGDCAFLQSSKWKESEYVWRPEVIALLGHDI